MTRALAASAVNAAARDSGATATGKDLLKRTGQLTASQREQAVLPHRHGGMGLRRFNEDVATAARLSSTALACAALLWLTAEEKATLSGA